MQLGSTFICNCNITLHVSDAFCVHLQEHLETVVAASSEWHETGWGIQQGVQGRWHPHLVWMPSTFFLDILTYDARKPKHKMSKVTVVVLESWAYPSSCVFVAVLNIMRKESSPDTVKIWRKIFLSHTHVRGRACMLVLLECIYASLYFSIL